MWADWSAIRADRSPSPMPPAPSAARPMSGGLLGYNGGSITQSYWDSYTTGQAAGIGAGAASSGLNEVTSDPAQSGAANYAYKQSAYAGFDFTPGNTSTGWFSIDGQTRPFGQWEYSTNISNAHQLQLMAMNLGASYRLTSNIDFSSGLAGEASIPACGHRRLLADRRFVHPVHRKPGRPGPCDLEPYDQPAIDQLCRTFRIYLGRSHAKQCQLAGRNHDWTESRRDPGRPIVGDHQQCLGDRRGRSHGLWRRTGGRESGQHRQQLGSRHGHRTDHHQFFHGWSRRME